MHGSAMSEYFRFGRLKWVTRDENDGLVVNTIQNNDAEVDLEFLK